MKRRKRATPWHSQPEPSQLIPELRRQWRASGRSWYDIAKTAKVNPVTVQRMLRATKLKPWGTRQIECLEAVAKALGCPLSFTSRVER